MTDTDRPRIGGILLAAGGSSRFGSPKQLYEFDGMSLIRRAAKTLVDSACDPVLVVLGAGADQIRAELAGLPVTTCVNEAWNDGLSTSISNGLDHLLKIDSDISAVVITLCDQPNITPSDIDLLVDEFRKTNVGIVAAKYSGVIGVPAAFGREHFCGLASLRGDKGARSLIRSNPDVVRTVTIENAAFDIDTPEDTATSNR